MKQKFSPEEILNFQDKIRTDPVWFMENILKRTPWEKEREIIESVVNNYETVVRSCNASGKTFTAGGIVNWWLMAYPGDGIVITTAPTGRQVREVLWREVRHAQEGKGIYPDGTVLQTQINLGPKWFALGLSTDESDKFQGYHSPNLLVVVDEASGVPEEIFEAIDGLKPTKILQLGNPMRLSGRFARSFKSPYTNKIHISAFDTPNLKEGKLVIPGVISADDVQKIKERYGEESDVYRVRVLGEFPKSEEDTLISIDEVEKAMNREVTVLPHFEKKMGVDVARYGNDRSIIVVRQMEKVLRKERLAQGDLMNVVGQVIKVAKEERVLAPNICVDVIGYGAGVVDRLKEQGWNVTGVNVAEKSSDSEHYANMRSELYNLTKEWLQTGSLPRDDDFYELANIKYSFNSKGQMLMESKEDMRSRGLESPDTADALMLTMIKKKGFINVAQSKPLDGFYNDRDLPY